METWAGGWRPPLVWRVLLVLARLAVPLVCRLRVTGDLSPAVRGGALILASNHIGMFDPLALVAACRVRRVAPRIMATGGLFRTPVVGPVLRASGHIRVDRRLASASAALPAAEAALAEGSVLVAYPEGRIGLDPGGWPERGKTGVARLALTTGTPVVAVAQWGAHEVLAYTGRWALLTSLGRAVCRRPVVRVHFGPVVDLAGLGPDTPGAALRATEAIMETLTAELRGLRPDEPDTPRFVDPTRPVSAARSRRPVPPGAVPPGAVDVHQW
jgi:1-acyl-sn-glycerol-3-phosphate acyltransferase